LNERRKTVSGKVVKAINEAGKVVAALTDLALKLGTLIAVVKMIQDSVN
jgi:hypothetical protein